MWLRNIFPVLQFYLFFLLTRSSIEQMFFTLAEVQVIFFFFLLWPCFGIIKRRQWHPTPVFLPGESQGWGSLVDCRIWGRRVGHDWSNLAAAVGIIRYFLLGNNYSFSQWPSMIVQTLVFNFPSSNEMETTRHFSFFFFFYFRISTSRNLTG